jgi:hypothetical protein
VGKDPFLNDLLQACESARNDIPMLANNIDAVVNVAI